jgi:hypothetical protein
MAIANTVAFFHRSGKATDDLAAYVVPEPDGTWFFGGVSRCA